MSQLERKDGRKGSEIRPAKISFDGLARVDGSARFSFGQSTSALASVSGPIEVRLHAENPSQATFDVSVRPLSSIPGIESKSLASTIRSLLAPSILLAVNPRTLIQLVIQALSPSSSSYDSSAAAKWDDGLIAAMINASSLALIKAGSIPMRGVVCAVAVGHHAKETVYSVDPSPEESAVLDGVGCFAFLFGHGVGSTPNDADCVCVWSSWRGVVGDDGDVLAVKEVASGAARRVWEAMKENVGTLGGLEKKEITKDIDVDMNLS